MARYYVNKNSQANGDHEVHKQGCSHMPLEHNRLYLGDFVGCTPAVKEAKKLILRLMVAFIAQSLVIQAKTFILMIISRSLVLLFCF
ncbi:hypothetical protein MACH09_14460 [Vibrio sp. MACH09]|nr:hypothetical protein MACH09_14460 [Vibrio sp. MACH09]